jgi:hypothetical protein
MPSPGWGRRGGSRPHPNARTTWRCACWRRRSVSEAPALRAGTRRRGGGVDRRLRTTPMRVEQDGGSVVRGAVGLVLRASLHQGACCFLTTLRRDPHWRMRRAGAGLRASAPHEVSSVCCCALATVGARWVSSTVCTRRCGRWRRGMSQDFPACWNHMTSWGRMMLTSDDTIPWIGLPHGWNAGDIVCTSSRGRPRLRALLSRSPWQDVHLTPSRLAWHCARGAQG